MNTIIAVLAFAGAGFMAFRLFKLVTSPEAKANRPGDDVWDAAKATADDRVTQILMDLSKPLSSLPSVYDAKNTPIYNTIQTKLLAAGGWLNGSVEVFLALQITAALIGCASLMVGFLGIGHKLLMAMIGATLIAYPYGTLSSKAKKRADEITGKLPDFAELLQMPLTGGLSVIAALDFTAQRSSGVVAEEVHYMLRLIRARAIDEGEAFVLAGERLGTPEARSFFQALHQAHIEGAKVIDTLASQSEALRRTAFQRQRAKLKKLPLKLVVIMFMHLMPLVFILIMVQFAYSFSQV